MNEVIIKTLVNTTNIKQSQIEATLKLLEEGSTIPFIARYRKEVTGNLDEEQIKLISDEYNRNLNLMDRKISVINLIDEKRAVESYSKNIVNFYNRLLFSKHSHCVY